MTTVELDALLVLGSLSIGIVQFLEPGFDAVGILLILLDAH